MGFIERQIRLPQNVLVELSPLRDRTPIATLSDLRRNPQCSFTSMEQKRTTSQKTAKAVETPRTALNPEPDDRGQFEVVEAYFDPEGRPIKRKGLGAARVSRAYDAQGHQIEERYYNAEGKPTVRKDLGAARISWRYDGDGRKVGTTLFGADGAPVRPHPPATRKRALERA